MKIETLNAERTERWLVKTGKSISNRARFSSGNVERDYRLGQLATRYDELKERAQELGIWEAYCDKFGWSHKHDGFDCCA